MTQLDIFMPFENGSIVIDVLYNHIGKENAIRMSELALECGLNERQVRAEIKALRKDRQEVILSSSQGYWLARRGEKDNMMVSRAISSIDTAIDLDYENILIIYKHLAQRKKDYPTLHGQIRALFIDDETTTVERYK